MILYVKQKIAVLSLPIGWTRRQWHVQSQHTIVLFAAILLSACRVEITSPKAASRTRRVRSNVRQTRLVQLMLVMPTSTRRLLPSPLRVGYLKGRKRQWRTLKSALRFLSINRAGSIEVEQNDKESDKYDLSLLQSLTNNHKHRLSQKVISIFELSHGEERL